MLLLYCIFNVKVWAKHSSHACSGWHNTVCVCSTCCHLLLLQVKTEEEEHTVDDLNEGKKYMFHVAAENEVGIGEFVELPEAAIPKSGFGESHS